MNRFEIIPNEQTPSTPKIDDINNFISENKESIEAFLMFAQNADNAAGLAANQVSFNGERFNKRMFAKNNNGKWSIIIDPTIEKLGMIRIKSEGCLTWKEQVIVSERNHRIIATYYDINGEKQTTESTGFDAQVWQHEINHLNGIDEVVYSKHDLPNYIEEKIERNSKCPCNSGKKYKKCCIEN